MYICVTVIDRSCTNPFWSIIGAVIHQQTRFQVLSMKCNPNTSLHISLLPPPPPIDVGYGSSWNTTSRVCKKYREMYNLCSLRLIIQYIFFSHCLFFPVKKASSYLSGWHSTVQYVKHAFINLLSVCILTSVA